jgi:hypothetical protein
MRFCTRVRGEPDENGVLRDMELVDVSLVGHMHIIGRGEDGYWHFPGTILNPVNGRVRGGAAATTDPVGDDDGGGGG